MNLKLWHIMIIQLIFAVLLIVVVNNAHASANVDCNEHKIYCHIVNNKPNINKKYAMRLSNIIYKKAKQYKVNPFLYSAIVAQESMYKLDAMNCVYGIRKMSKLELDIRLDRCISSYEKLENYIDCVNKVLNDFKRGLEMKICTDFGLSQIHYRTVKRYDFEIEKLTTNLEYAVSAGMKVLKDFQKRYKHKEDTWWSRYNSSTPAKRRIYEALVRRYI